MARFLFALSALLLLAAVVLAHPVEDSESEEDEVVQRGWKKWALQALKALGVEVGIPAAKAGFNKLSEKFNENFDVVCIDNVAKQCKPPSEDLMWKLLVPACIKHYYEEHNYCKKN